MTQFEMEPFRYEPETNQPTHHAVDREIARRKIFRPPATAVGARTIRPRPRPPVLRPLPIVPVPTGPWVVERPQDVAVDRPRDTPPEPGRSTPGDSKGGSFAASGEPTPAISEGTEYVRWIQSTLNHVLSLRLPLDGIMSPQVRAAIRDFQTGRKLPADGIVGPDTQRALIEARRISRSLVRELQHSEERMELASSDAGSPDLTVRALTDLAPFSAAATQPTIENALSVVRAISLFHRIPWRLGYTILQHEGGIRLFKHHDGVMQTTQNARRAVIPRIPRLMKLNLLELPPTDQTPDTALNSQLQREFTRRLAVQIAAGMQELKTNLDKFNGYVALAFQAYNAGAGWGYYTATRGRNKGRPAGITSEQWESMCRFGAALLHQPANQVRIDQGVWQCDANIPTWFSHIPVYDRQSGLMLVAYKYLRSIRECIRSGKPPAASCTRSMHGASHRTPGIGPVRCRMTRPGAFDKLYRPQLLGRYNDADPSGLRPLVDDNRPLKVLNGRLFKMSLASGAPEAAIPV